MFCRSCWEKITVASATGMAQASPAQEPRPDPIQDPGSDQATGPGQDLAQETPIAEDHQGNNSTTPDQNNEQNIAVDHSAVALEQTPRVTAEQEPGPDQQTGLGQDSELETNMPAGNHLSTNYEPARDDRYINATTAVEFDRYRYNADALERTLRKTEEKLSMTEQELQKCKGELAERTDRLQKLGVQRLLTPTTGASHVDQLFPTLRQIAREVEGTMTNVVSPWIERAEEYKLHPGIVLPVVFHACRRCVEKRYAEIVRFFQGEAADTRGNAMDPETKQFMLKHLRRHYTTLFPLLEAKAREQALGDVIARVIRSADFHPHDRDEEDRQWTHEALIRCGIEKVVHAYLQIVVHVHLQEPRGTFTDDCKRGNIVVPFDPRFHQEPSIDGDAFPHPKHKRCIVVFPCLLGQAPDGAASTALYSKSFFLAV